MLKRLKSIKGFIYMILILLFLTLGISVGVFSYNTNLQMELYQTILERNQYLSELILAIESAKLHFDVVNRTNDQDRYIAYLEQSNIITIKLNELKRLSQSDKKMLTYIRVLGNMNDYQSEKSNAYYSLDSGLVLEFNERAFIQTMFIEMSGVMGEMVAYDLENQSIINQEYFEQFNRKQRSGVMMLIAFITMTIVIVVMMLISILRRVNQMVIKAVALSNREWNVPDLDENSFFEFNQLAIAVNQMKTDIRNYITKMHEKNQLEKELVIERLNVETKERLLKQSQLSTLQAQVNPHFLFNTLNIIGKSAVLNDVDNVLELIESISYMMRYAIDNQKELVTVRDELVNTRHYLSIQKVRFQNYFEYDIDVKDEMLQVQIPSMIIQPIVENSFKYGFMNRRHHNYLRIKIERQEKYACITIFDNGIGIDEQRLQSIFDASPVGLGNVARRLELQFEENNLLTIESEVGKFTKVTLKIPLKE